MTEAITLTVPAEAGYLTVVRTAAAAVAGRLGATVDDIEDLRIAVNEACSALLPAADPGTQLDCRFELEDAGRLGFRVQAPSATGEVPEPGSFAWMVLESLTGQVDVGIDQADGRRTAHVAFVRTVGVAESA
jgi:serine/threonine-protein kinase RsbW